MSGLLWLENHGNWFGLRFSDLKIGGRLDSKVPFIFNTLLNISKGELHGNVRWHMNNSGIGDELYGWHKNGEWWAPAGGRGRQRNQDQRIVISL